MRRETAGPANQPERLEGELDAVVLVKPVKNRG
jgi:hypothetical protein